MKVIKHTQMNSRHPSLGFCRLSPLPLLRKVVTVVTERG